MKYKWRILRTDCIPINCTRQISTGGNMLYSIQEAPPPPAAGMLLFFFSLVTFMKDGEGEERERERG